MSIKDVIARIEDKMTKKRTPLATNERLSAIVEQIEGSMKVLKEKIDAGNRAAAPFQAKIDALLEKQKELQVEIDAAVAEKQAAKGDPAEWVALKKEYGTFAATRMQLREALKAL